MPNYDKDKDYMKLMEQAAETGDYRAAADYERQRNDKITGEGLNVAQTSKYQAYGDAAKQASSYLQQLNSRPRFEYDAGSDPLYQQYKDMYMRQGNQAMGDTVGKVAAMTGGYGNSYAQTAGQQIYQQYMDKLNDRLPELYNAAYSRYAQEGTDLQNAYDRAANQENLEYNRLLAADQTAYQRQQDQLNRSDSERDRAYSIAAAMLSGGVMPSSEMLAAAGLSSADAQKLMQAAMSSVGGNGGGGSGSGGGSYRGSSGGGKQLSQSALNNLLKAYDSGNLDELERLMESYESTGYDISAFTQMRDVGALRNKQGGGNAPSTPKLSSTANSWLTSLSQQKSGGAPPQDLINQIYSLLNSGKIDENAAQYFISQLDLWGYLG